LIPGKGFDLAIRGLGELKRIAPHLPWEFILVGDGPSAAELKELAVQCGIADRVTFAGALSFEEVQRHYAVAHVAIMPSTKEGWPKVIAEAWAHGAIPLAAPWALAHWILQDERAGIVFEATPIALAEALCRLLSSPGRMKVTSQGLFHYAEEMSLEHFKARLEQVLVERCGLQ
jgi:phosphatidylinositol alpha-1,6-mannosyltransferase